MVNSLLPAWLVLHLHLSPLQFGVIDGLYSGFAIALLSLLAGYLADRERATKGSRAGRLRAVGSVQAAAARRRRRPGHGSCSSWESIGWQGHSCRPARCAHLAEHASRRRTRWPSPFTGRWMPAARCWGRSSRSPCWRPCRARIDAVWVTSFFFAIIGVAVLWLFVPRASRRGRGRPSRARDTDRVVALEVAPLHGAHGLRRPAGATTISDGFLYLLLQRRARRLPDSSRCST